VRRDVSEFLKQFPLDRLAYTLDGRRHDGLVRQFTSGAAPDAAALPGGAAGTPAGQDALSR